MAGNCANVCFIHLNSADEIKLLSQGLHPLWKECRLSTHTKTRMGLADRDKEPQGDSKAVSKGERETSPRLSRSQVWQEAPYQLLALGMLAQSNCSSFIKTVTRHKTAGSSSWSTYANLLCQNYCGCYARESGSEEFLPFPGIPSSLKDLQIVRMECHCATPHVGTADAR